MTASVNPSATTSLIDGGSAVVFIIPTDVAPTVARKAVAMLVGGEEWIDAVIDHRDGTSLRTLGIRFGISHVAVRRRLNNTSATLRELGLLPTDTEATS